MIEIDKDEGAGGPLTWRLTELNGKDTVAVFDTAGHYVVLTGHRIGSEGTVSPSVRCRHEGCDFHEFIRLVGWPVAKQ